MGEQWTCVGNDIQADGTWRDPTVWWRNREDDPIAMARFLDSIKTRNAELAAREGWRLGELVSAGLVTMPGGDVPSVRVVWEAVRDGAQVNC